MVVFLIADGYDNIPEKFKRFATDKNFLDETVLQEKGFMK